jgi:hypothetical protein
MDVAYSIRNVPIRLTHERWVHIVENHDDMAGYYEDVLAVIEDPEFVLRGHGGSLIAARGYGKRQYLMTVYRELSAADGFVITAYFTSKLDRKRITWKNQ